MKINSHRIQSKCLKSGPAALLKFQYQFRIKHFQLNGQNLNRVPVWMYVSHKPLVLAACHIPNKQFITGSQKFGTYYTLLFRSWRFDACLRGHAKKCASKIIEIHWKPLSFNSPNPTQTTLLFSLCPHQAKIYSFANSVVTRPPLLLVPGPAAPGIAFRSLLAPLAGGDKV